MIKKSIFLVLLVIFISFPCYAQEVPKRTAKQIELEIKATLWDIQVMSQRVKELMEEQKKLTEQEKSKPAGNINQGN